MGGSRDTIEDARGSVPMSPPPRPAIPPPRDRQGTGEHAALGEDDAARALRVAIEGRAVARELAGIVGSVPDALNPAGEGALGLLFQRVDALTVEHGKTNAKIDAVGASVDKLTAELRADREAADAREKAREAEAGKRREPWARVGWIVLTVALGTVVTATIGGAAAYLGSHLQWRSPAAHP